MSLDFDPTGAGSPLCDVFDVDGFAVLTGAERDRVFMDTERQI